MDSVSGDGIDSNGTLTVSGGTVVVWTADTADNQPLDADGAIIVSGGTVLAAGGSAGMGMNFLFAAVCYFRFLRTGRATRRRSDAVRRTTASRKAVGRKSSLG